MILALSGCIDSDVQTPPELVGIWKLADSSSSGFPTECRRLQLEFTPQRRLITVSGELKLVVKISTSRRDSGFLVRKEILDHNNKPNCQGKSAHHVLSNFAFEIYFERNGELLRQYIWTKNSGRFVEFVRVN